jgi:hypothetical protein
MSWRGTGLASEKDHMKPHREILLGLLLLCQMSCRDLPPQIHVPTIHLTLEDRGVIDASLRVTVDADDKPNRVKITLDGIAIFDANAKDTVVYCDALLPKQSYTLRAYRISGNTIFDSSEALTITTLDSTSHSFSWMVDSLGDGNGSFLRDLAIISDTNIWAVGNMYKRDSTGNFEADPYNVARWNGSTWQLIRVNFPICDNNGVEIGTAYFHCLSVYAFGGNDVWLTDGGSFVHWNGASFQRMCLLPGTTQGEIEEIWGSSAQNLYAVGLHGAIIFFDGTTWRKQLSGTDVDLLDVWGNPDGKTVWACGYNIGQVGTALFRNAGRGWELAYDGTSSEFRIRLDSLSGTFTSVYTPSAKRIFVGSSAGVYSAPSTTQGIGKRLSFTSTYFPGFPNRLRGNGVNDFTIVGDYGFVAHFNGLTWQYYDQLSTSDIRLQSVAQQGNLLCAVGHLYNPINSRAIVFRGRR